MRLRTILVAVSTLGLTVIPAFVSGGGSSAGAASDCTITGTAANDTINGTSRDDVICTRAGSDVVDALDGDDVVKLGQGDDAGYGNDGKDTIKGQADDDGITGAFDNDKLIGGQGDDCLGVDCAHYASGSTLPFQNEDGNDLLKSRDGVAGNDDVDGGNDTDRCVVDPGDVRTPSNGNDLSCEQS
ncbi:MAG: calcium-binding protein [Actinomycetota bacterium]